MAELPFRAHALCPAQLEAWTPEILPFNGLLLRPAVVILLRNRQNWATELRIRARMDFLERVCTIEMSMQPVDQDLLLGREDQEEWAAGQGCFHAPGLPVQGGWD